MGWTTKNGFIVKTTIPAASDPPASTPAFHSGTGYLGIWIWLSTPHRSSWGLTTENGDIMGYNGICIFIWPTLWYESYIYIYMYVIRKIMFRWNYKPTHTWALFWVMYVILYWVNDFMILSDVWLWQAWIDSDKSQYFKKNWWPYWGVRLGLWTIMINVLLVKIGLSRFGIPSASSFTYR